MYYVTYPEKTLSVKLAQSIGRLLAIREVASLNPVSIIVLRIKEFSVLG